MTKEEIKNLPIYSVTPDPDQARKHFSEEHLRELADSIAANGVILPIIVSPLGESGEHYQIIAGERRWRASIMAGLETIPAIVRELDDFTRQVQSLIENVQRSDLNPLEEAKAYENLIEEFDLSHDELAERVGKNRATITNSLRLLKLPPFVQDCLKDGRISSGHAKVILGLHSEKDMVYLCGKIVQGAWSVKQSAEAAEKLKEGKLILNSDDKMPEDITKKKGELEKRALELQLTRHFGTQVKLEILKDKSGTVKFRFNDYEELERLLELWK